MSFSTATGISFIDSRNKSATLLLPSVTDIPGRILYVKDGNNAFGSSSITLSTQINQSFDNGLGLKTLQDTDGYVLLASDGVSKWRQIGGTAIKEGYIGNARISSLFVTNISTTSITTKGLISRSTIEINTKFNVGPNTPLYRGNQLFTPLQLNMSLYDLPISTMTDIATWRVNVLSTFTTQGEFNIPIDFGAYPYKKTFYSTFQNDIPLNLNSRSMNIKLWGTGGNAGNKGTIAPPTAYLRGGNAAYMRVDGFYPSKVFGTYYDPAPYALYVPPVDTTILGYPAFVVSSVVRFAEGPISDVIYSGRGAIHGPVIRMIYQGSNYDLLSPASGGGGFWTSNLDSGINTPYNGGDATSVALNNITNVLWYPGLTDASNNYGIGGGGATVGSCNLARAGKAGTSLNNLGVYCYPYNTPNYQNGTISIVNAFNAQDDPDWLEAGGLVYKYGLGGGANDIDTSPSGLGGGPLAVIEQPYDRLTSNLTFVGNGTFTGLITAPVTFRLTGPDGLYLAINGQTLINDWTISNQMHGISTIMQINQDNPYNIRIMAFNATSVNNNLKFEYYIEDKQTVGDQVVLAVSSGIFLNNASTTFTSSVTANSIFTNTFVGQNLQILTSNIQGATPFYVGSPATFEDTLIVKKRLSVGYTVHTSSVFTSSIVFENTYSRSDKQEMILYDSTITIGKLQLMTQLNVNSLVLGSTLAGLGSYGYISTITLGSANFNSTVAGLGSSGYLSSLNTVGAWNFVSTNSLRSTVQGLGTIGYVSSAIGLDFILQSTVKGLATVGFLSTNALTSTVTGLGTIGYMSSAVGIDVILQSTNRGLGTFGYASSFAALGLLGYVSTSGLTSSLLGMGNLGFLSSFVTQSSISSGLTNINILTASSICLNVAGTEVARFTSSGLMGLGLSSPLVTLDIGGSVFIRSTLYVSSAIIINKGVNVNANSILDVNGAVTLGSLFVEGEGTFGTTVTAQSFATPSDRALKGDIQTISGAMDYIQKSRGVGFKWLSTGVQDYGYIAQEVESFLPEAVLRQESTLYVKYDVFVPFITEGLKSLQSEISDIRAILLRNGLR